MRSGAIIQRTCKYTSFFIADEAEYNYPQVDSKLKAERRRGGGNQFHRTRFSPKEKIVFPEGRVVKWML